MATAGPERARHGSPVLIPTPGGLKLGGLKLGGPKLGSPPAGAKRWTAQRIAYALAMLFLACSMVGVACLAMLMPPFQNGDEENHFLRADQVSRGRLVAVPVDARAGGGKVDINIEHAADLGAPVIFHPERKFSRALLVQQNEIPWGTPTLLGYANTALYPPWFYIPAAVATRLGRGAGLSIVQTLQLARLASGVACVALGAIAVAIAGGAAAWIFVVLCLPMTLALMAAVSHDGLSIGCSAIAAALTASSISRNHTSGARLCVCSVMLLLLATDKPPLAPLALSLVALPGLRLALRLLALSGVCAGSLAWARLVAPFTGAFTRDNIAPSEQLHFIVHQPWLVAPIAYQTLALQGRAYLNEFVGVLGWLDTELPTIFHTLAWLELGAAFLLCLPGRSLRWGRGAAWCALGMLAASGAIFAAQYMTWTPVGQGWVDGVQGRYFLPVALFLPCLLPPARTSPAGIAWPMAPALGLLALFPVVSIVVALNAIVWRYYL